MNNQTKLLFTAFVAIIIGVVLIGAIGDEVSVVSLASATISNESVSLAVTTATIENETITLTQLGDRSTGTLSNNFLTSLTALRNITSENVLGFCNITLVTGELECNATNSTTAFADYTFNHFSTGLLANDELISLDACRNSTMTAVTVDTVCNVTLATGAIKIAYDNFTDDLAFIDYKFTPDTFVRGQTSRTLLNITILLFAIAIIAIGIGFAIMSFKVSGVM